MSTDYRGPMDPYPGLESMARQVYLARAALRLFYFEAGAATSPAILMVHGLGDEADTWRHLIAPLSQCHRALAPDLPGFGRSELLPGRYSLDAAELVLLELLDTLDIDRVLLVGHSLGAMLCHALCLHHRDRVTGLVLIGGGISPARRKVDLQSLLFVMPGVGEWIYNRFRRDPQAAYDSLRPFYHNLDGLPSDEREFLFRRVNQRVWSDRQRRAFFGTLRSMAGFERVMAAVKSQISAIDTSTVVLWGEHDQVNAVESGEALVAAQPSARLVIVPGAGHNVQQEAPQAVLEAVVGMAPAPDRPVSK
jgi:pimeloyl-ACP methyl ester carboxylesterase